MLKVKVTVPAACTGIGPGLGTLGLALALQDTLEFSLRSDTQCVIDLQGEGDQPASLRHPAMRAAITLFQSLERAPAGFSLAVTSRIPADCGLGDLAALTVGGLIGANNLLDAPLKRETLIDMACELIGQPAAVITSFLGGLTITSSSDTKRDMLYRRLEVAALKVVLIVPELPDYAEQIAQATIPPIALEDAALSLSRTVLLVEAFRKNDLDLLGRVMQDHLIESQREPFIPGFEAAVNAAKAAGAAAVSLSGTGPALIAITQVNHKRVEDAMQAAFAEVKVRSRAWTLNVDTQGVAISLMR